MESSDDVWMLGIRRRPDPQKERAALLLEQQKLDLKAFLNADKHKKLTTSLPIPSSSSSSSSRSTWNPNPPLIKDNPPPLPFTSINDQPYLYQQQQQQQPFMINQQPPSINNQQPFMNIQQPYMYMQQPFMNIQPPYMNQEQQLYMNQQLQLQQHLFMMQTQQQQPFMNPQQSPQQPFTNPQLPNLSSDPYSTLPPQQYHMNPSILPNQTNRYQQEPIPPSHYSSINTLSPILNTAPIRTTTLNHQEQSREFKLEQAKLLQAELQAQIEEKRRRDVLAKQDRLTTSSYTNLNADVPAYLSSSSSSSAPAPHFGRRRFDYTSLATPSDQLPTATTEHNSLGQTPQPETQHQITDTTSTVLAKSHLRGQTSYLPKWEQDLIEQKHAKQKLASMELQQQILEKKKAKADLITKTKELERLEIEKFNLECLNLKSEQEHAENVRQLQQSGTLQTRVEARSQWGQPHPKPSVLKNLDVESSTSKQKLTSNQNERKIPHHLHTKPESPQPIPIKPQPRTYSPPLPSHQHGSLHLQQQPAQPLLLEIPAPLIKRHQSPPVPTLQHHRNMDDSGQSSTPQMPRSQSPPIPTLQNRKNMKDDTLERTTPEVSVPLINRPQSPPIPTLQRRRNMENHDHCKESSQAHVPPANRPQSPPIPTLQRRRNRENHDHSSESSQTHVPPANRPQSPPIPTLQRRTMNGNAQASQPESTIVKQSPPIPAIQNKQSRTQLENSTTPQLSTLPQASSTVPVNRPKQRPPSLHTIGHHIKVMELGQSRNDLGQLPSSRRRISARTPPTTTVSSSQKSNEQIMAELKDLQHQLIAERDRVGKAMSPQQQHQLLPSVSEFLYTSTGKPLYDNASKDAASWVSKHRKFPVNKDLDSRSSSSSILQLDYAAV